MGSQRVNHERGASLVEFAVLLPLLVVLLLGIVEFGWLYAQTLDLRHGAREGARIAASTAGNGADIVTATCATMDLNGMSLVEVRAGHLGNDLGDPLIVGVRGTPASLTGFFDAILPTTVLEEVEARLERNPNWSNTPFISC